MSFPEVVLRLYVPIAFLGVLVYVYWNKFKKFFRWLKGSRVSHCFREDGTYYKISAKLRTVGDRYFQPECDRPVGSVIEINYGPFRRRSAIYGPADKNWKIAKTSLGCNAQGGFGEDWVSLTELSSLPVERALHLINKQSSLQALMSENGDQRNRIAELKKASTEPLAVLRALDLKMLDDKQRFRAPAAKEIHANIRFALRELFVDGLITNPNSSVAAWMEKFEKPEAKVIR
jgi:hypothetical protein